ncbi:hypothetical protein HDR60_03155 [bacterium]|nr:hypothetical protein [bacterium]
MNKKAIKCYTRRVNGILTAVYLYYLGGKFYVNIVSVTDDKIIRQCYNISKEMFDIYMLGDDTEKQSKLIAKGGRIYRAFDKKKSRYKFWTMRNEYKLKKEARDVRKRS